jgi:hypothetical protein
MDMQRREPVLDRLQQLEVPGQRQIRVHAALHEDLRAADLDDLPDLLEQLRGGQRVGVSLVPVAAKGAERAPRRADVGVVDVAVDNVGPNRLPVQVPAAGVGPSAELMKRHLAVEAQGLAGADAERAGGHVAQHRRVEDVLVVSWGSRHRSNTRPMALIQESGP